MDLCRCCVDDRDRHEFMDYPGLVKEGTCWGCNEYKEVIPATHGIEMEWKVDRKSRC